MTPDVEAVALAWVRQYLAGHHCDRCGRQWITRASVAVLVHECEIVRRGRVDWRPPRQRHDDERAQWATEIFGALETELGDRALLPMEGEDNG